MYDPTLISHVTTAVHEDRVRALQRSRPGRSCAPSSFARWTLGLYRNLDGVPDGYRAMDKREAIKVLIEL
jgi:hypothetical protein